MKIVGIDIGTTSVCGIILDTVTGKAIKSVTQNSNAFIDECMPYEKIQSVEIIMNKAMGILEEFVHEGVDAIGVTGQMHGIVYTDNEGNAVSPLYTWQDERGNESYKGTTYAQFIGSPSGYGSVTDFYNRENGIRPESAVCYMTIQDYLVMKLCSLKVPLIHETDFASFGKGVSNNKADTVSGFVLAGKWKDIPVACAIGDNQASVFSTLPEDGILVNVGTGSQVSIVSDREIVAENVETRPYFDGKYLAVGAALCGGRAYAVLKNFYSKVFGYISPLDDNKVYEVMAQMLKKSKESLKVDTRFAGTRSDKSVTGSVCGITESNFTPEALTLGVLKGMTEELYLMYRATGITKAKLVGSGNGIRKNPYLVKTAEDMFGLKMKIPCHKEEAACGAALYAGIALGIFKDSKEAKSLIKYEDMRCIAPQ